MVPDNAELLFVFTIVQKPLRGPNKNRNKAQVLKHKTPLFLFWGGWEGEGGWHPKAPSLRGKQAQLGHAMLAQLAEVGHAVLAQLGSTDQSIVNQPTNNTNKLMSK